MKGYLVLILLSVFVILGCQSSENIPVKLINEKDMAYFLAELQLLESQVTRTSFNSVDSAKVSYLYLAQKKLEEKGFDTISYKENFSYYSKHPERFANIYSEAIEILNAKKDESSNNTDI